MPKYRPVTIEGYTLGTLNGDPVVTFDDASTGRRRRFRLGTGLTQEQAEAELHAFVKRREVYLSRSDLKCEDLFQRYIADKKLDGKPYTNQEFHWRALKPMFGALSPSDIDKRVCKAYIKRRTEAGRKPGTIWTELTALASVLNWARKDAKLIKDEIHITKPSKPAPKDKRLTKEQAQTLLEHCHTTHIKLFVILALATAARAGALLGLTWDRVHLDTGLIDLHDPEHEETTKRRAIVPMNAMARAALAKAQGEAVTGFVIEWNGKGVGDLKKGLAAAAKAAGFKPGDVSPHIMRHSAACWMAEAGVPMSEISQYLGHTSTAITERTYARYSPNYLRTAASALELPTMSLTKKSG